MPRAREPSRSELLESERGEVRSEFGRLSAALVFPNTYSVGMSNLAVHALYRMINGHPEFWCDRVFIWADGAPRALETGRPPADFDVVALSVSYELDELNAVELLRRAGYDLACLADVTDDGLYGRIMADMAQSHGDLCRRLRYIHGAQKRFYRMLEAWKAGDVETIGSVFREDGIGLRDDYEISGPELESMCDIARTVGGVLGERMLGGGDKGASGALVLPGSVDELKRAVEVAYPRSHPDLAGNYAVHVCGIVDGVAVLEGLV